MSQGAAGATSGGLFSAEAIRELEVWCQSLEPALRARLAEEWAGDALAEHASVASFSRFSLHLMAVAAPPELLQATHEAALDEIRHARLCFRLASIYAGEPLGPGPLPLEGDILGPLDLPSIAVAAVREGCIGETLASLDASAAYEASRVAAPREALAIISEDEARHAELSWRFVRWALDASEGAARAAIERTFDEMLRSPAPAPAAADPLDEALAWHGRLSPARKQASMASGLVEVVRPAAGALLGKSY